jgi:long-chain fatty acid transport protein
MKFNKPLIASAVALALAAPMSAMATNGYFSHGYGTKSKALAGGGSALPQDAMAAATNPAGMAFVGERMDVGVAIFSPHRSYETTGTPTGACLSATQCTFGIDNGEVESENEMFFIPHFGYNWQLDANSTVGLSIYGNGGMNSDYEDGSATVGAPVGAVPPGTTFNLPGTFGAGKAGVDLAQLFFNVSYARKIDAKSSWGVSAILAYQRFSADGFGAFAGYSTDGAKILNNGYDDATGFGLKLGWQGEVSPGLTLAASYQSEINMSEFDEYAGLFAEDGDFDIPATWTLGLAYDTGANGTVTFDVQNIAYSDIAAIANPLFPNLGQFLAGDFNSGFGGSNGPGYGWEDMTIYKLGYQWSTSPQWTWRVGYSTTDQPIPDSEVMLNITAPAVVEDHFTFGFTNKRSANTEFNFAAMYAPEETVTGPNPLDPAQEIEIKMDQWELEASWGWKF